MTAKILFTDMAYSVPVDIESYSTSFRSNFAASICELISRHFFFWDDGKTPLLISSMFFSPIFLELPRIEWRAKVLGLLSGQCGSIFGSKLRSHLLFCADALSDRRTTFFVERNEPRSVEIYEENGQTRPFLKANITPTSFRKLFMAKLFFFFRNETQAHQFSEEQFEARVRNIRFTQSQILNFPVDCLSKLKVASQVTPTEEVGFNCESKTSLIIRNEVCNFIHKTHSCNLAKNQR